jgi:hypothetical protein
MTSLRARFGPAIVVALSGVVLAVACGGNVVVDPPMAPQPGGRGGMGTGVVAGGGSGGVTGCGGGECSPDGESCVSDCDCCGRVCGEVGVCEPPSACNGCCAQGSPCSTEAECCSGMCNIYSGFCQ